MISSDSPKTAKVKFDATINLGHILTFLGFIGTGIVMYQKIDTRIIILEESRKTQQLRDDNQDKAMDSNMREIRDTANDIKKSVDRINDKIDKQQERQRF